MLFEELKRLHSQLRLDEAASGERGLLSFAPTQLNRAIRDLFASLRQGGMEVSTSPLGTLHVLGPAYSEAVRGAAKRDLSIERLVVLPYRGYLSEPSLLSEWEADRSAGVDVQFCTALDGSDLLLTPSVAFEASGFGIWDGHTVTYPVHRRGPSGSVQLEEWIVSRRPEDIEAANSRWQRMLRVPRLEVMSDHSLETQDIFEPIRRTCSLSRGLSTYACARQSPSCGWLHGAWQDLRLLDLVESPSYHSEFFLQELQIQEIEDTECSLLICAPTDYSLLAYAERATAGSRRKYERISAVDQCETPLALVSWYAASAGLVVDCLHRDPTTHHEPPGAFSVVASCDYLSQCSDEQKPTLLRSWHEVLRPGGRVVATVSIDPAGGPASPTKKEVDDFAVKAFRLASLWQSGSETPPGDLAALAREYAQHVVSWPFTSEHRMSELFRSSGFGVRIASRARGNCGFGSRVSAEVVATRL